MNFGTSVHALTEWSQPVKSFRQVLGEAAEIGYSSIMLMHLPGGPALTAATPDPQAAMLDLAQSDLALVRQAVADAGLTVGCVYQGLTKVGNADEIAATTRGLTALAHMAEAFGTDIVLPNAGAAPRALMPHEEKLELITALAGAMTAALNDAPAATRIAPDIHYGGIIETVADCRALYRLAPDPRVGITLNIGHMTTQGEAGWTLLEQDAERVHVVAWKDHRVPPPPEATHPIYSVELGTGQSPFANYAVRLPEDGGGRLQLITLEHVPLEQKKGALQRSLQYMQKLWIETH
jgi:sugar phosphate isomerase/epimerase